MWHSAATSSRRSPPVRRRWPARQSRRPRAAATRGGGAGTSARPARSITAVPSRRRVVSTRCHHAATDRRSPLRTPVRGHGSAGLAVARGRRTRGAATTDPPGASHAPQRPRPHHPRPHRHSAPSSPERSDGMGLVIATRLAAAGAEVVLPVRNPAKGEAAVAAIREAAPARRRVPARAGPVVARLGGRPRRRPCVDEGRPIHVLINNAGVMTPPDRQTTADGFELQLGTNHLGPLRPRRRTCCRCCGPGGARVTSQTSVAASRGAINWDDLNWEQLVRRHARLPPVEDRGRAVRPRAPAAQRGAGLGHHEQPLPPRCGAHQPARRPARGRAREGRHRQRGHPADVPARPDRDRRVRRAPRAVRRDLARGRGGRFYGPRGPATSAGRPPSRSSTARSGTSTRHAGCGTSPR